MITIKCGNKTVELPKEIFDVIIEAVDGERGDAADNKRRYEVFEGAAPPPVVKRYENAKEAYNSLKGLV